MCEEESVKYLRDLIREKEEVEINGKDIVAKVLSQEIVRIREGGRPLGKDTRLLDVYNEKPVKVTAKVLVPVKEHPRFNFVGKLLGPKGNSLKALQEETMTKMAVLGKGSMKDKLKEQQLRNSPDPKHSHLQEDLHVEITAFSSPAEAHARVAYALSCVRKYMIPDSNDQIRQNQMREIQILKKLETSEDTASDAMAVNKDSGNESDASNSPPPNNSSPNSTHQQTNSHSRNNTSPNPSIHQANSSTSPSLLLNNNSLTPSYSLSHSHPYNHSHTNKSITHAHPNNSVLPSHPNNSPAHHHPNHLHSPCSPHRSSTCVSPTPPKYTSILNKVTIQRFTQSTHGEEKLAETPILQINKTYCCDQTNKVPTQQTTNILDRIMPGNRSHNKRDHDVSMDFEYTHPDYFRNEEPVIKKCK